MLRRLARPARRALDVPHYYGEGLFRVFAIEPAFLWAQAIAFKVLVTLIPLVLLATGIFGLVLRQADPFATVSSFLRSFLPTGQSDAIIELVFKLQEASGAVTLVGGGALLVTVVTLFSSLRYVIGAAMGEGRHCPRPLLPGYVFDLRMVLQVGSLFVASFAVTFALRFLTARSGVAAEALGLDAETVAAASRGVVRAVALVVPYLLTLGMLFQLYYFVPAPHPPWKSAAVGAAVAAVLFEAAKNGFAVYASTVGGFDKYGAEDEALGGLGGVFGLVLAFVFWIYFSGLILITGAVVTSLYEAREVPDNNEAAAETGDGESPEGAVGARAAAAAGGAGEDGSEAVAVPAPPPRGPILDPPPLP